MVGTTTALNQVQSLGGETKEGRVTNANTGLYTVPAGKKAKVTAVTGVVNAVGGDATYAIAIKRGVNFRPIGPFVAVGPLSSFTGELNLIAGDIITNVGDAGATNATVDMTATVKEYDA